MKDNDSQGSDGEEDEIDAEDGEDGDIITAGPEDKITADPGDRVDIRDQEGNQLFSGTFSEYEAWIS